MSTGRLEAFSDGVMAVAITLLVLDIRVPEATAHHSLAHELLRRWPTYAAYLISFLTIGIIWINHHRQISRLGGCDHALLMLNLLLLMTISVIPFATSLMATYLKLSHGDNLAAAVYAGVLLAMGLAFTALNHRILFGRPELLKTSLSEAERRTILRRALTGVAPYALAVGLAAVSAYATLAVTAAVAVFYALPFASAGESSA